MKRDCLDLWVKLYVVKIVMDESTFFSFHNKMFFKKWMGAIYLLEFIVITRNISSLWVGHYSIEAGLDGLQILALLATRVMFAFVRCFYRFKVIYSVGYYSIQYIQFGFD